MRPRELLFFTFWVSIPLVMILSMLLTGCSPAAIRESEIIIEEVADKAIEEDLERRKQ